MRSVAGRPQTVLDLVRESLLDSRRASDIRSIENIASRLCDRLNLLPAAALQERLPVEADRTTVFIPAGEIRYVEARGHVVSVAVLDRCFRFRGTLEECENRLRAHGFLRAHRAYLVNAQHVLAVTPIHSGLYLLHVDDRARSRIPVSRSYAPEIRRSLAS
ncbi:MAG: LytR/AlgR family response regulator transcription factor [Vulcanimicrobiaceae bacterium]